MPDLLQYSTSADDDDTGYREQWLSVGATTVIQIATKRTEVRFVVRGATGLVRSAPTAGVPEVSSSSLWRLGWKP